MQTLYSLTLMHDDGRATVVDYLGGAGWWRHEFDSGGEYRELAASSAAALMPLALEGGPSLVYELRKCAEAIGVALKRARAPEAPRLRSDRRDVLERLRGACDAAWDEALRKVVHAPHDDPAAVARATRAVEFMRASRELARMELAAG